MRIFKLIQKKPRTCRQIADLIGKDTNFVWVYLQRLDNMGLVWTNTDESPIVYHPVAQGAL